MVRSTPISTKPLEAATPEVYTSKWGRIEIFNGDNYPSFAIDCQAALVAANAWRIVRGIEVRPAGNGNAALDWDKRQGFAVQIIFSSTDKTYKQRISRFLDDNNPTGMWNRLQEADRSRDAIFISNVKDAFQEETFDPVQMTVRQFVTRLEAYRGQIATTDNPITDDDMRLRLLNALPTDEGWRTVKLFCLRDNSSLEQTITILESNEGPLLASREPDKEVAQFASTRGRGKTQDERIKEAVEKEKKKWNRERERERRQSSKRHRSRSPSQEYSDNCWFCDKPGHQQKNCQRYKRARRRERRGSKSSTDDSDKGKRSKSASAHVAISAAEPFRADESDSAEY